MQVSKKIEPRSEDRAHIVTRAACRAATRLGLSQSDLAAVLGVSTATMSRMMKGTYDLKEGQKEFELAVLFIRVFRSLDAITGGDSRVNVEWMKNMNTALGGVPAEMVRKIAGLTDVVTYLDSRRAPF